MRTKRRESKMGRKFVEDVRRERSWVWWKDISSLGLRSTTIGQGERVLVRTWKKK